jgi:hypothetical protein
VGSNTQGLGRDRNPAARKTTVSAVEKSHFACNLGSLSEPIWPFLALFCMEDAPFDAFLQREMRNIEVRCDFFEEIMIHIPMVWRVTY